MAEKTYTCRDEFLEDLLRQALCQEKALEYLEAVDPDDTASYASPWVSAQLGDESSHFYQQTEGQRSVETDRQSSTFLIYVGVRIKDEGKKLEHRTQMRRELGRGIEKVHAALTKHFSAAKHKAAVRLDGSIAGISRTVITGMEISFVLRAYDEVNYEGFARISGVLRYKSHYHFTSAEEDYAEGL